MRPEELIPGLAAFLGVDPGSMAFVQRSQNAVYEFGDRMGIRRIARVTADSHRRRPEIEDELAWIVHLHRSGLEVCAPLPQAGREWVRPWASPEGDQHVVIFTRATGRPLAPTDLTPDLYRRHGQLLGRLHSLSRLSPPRALAGRKRWEAERYFTTDIPTYLPEAVQGPLLNHFRSLQARLAAFPADPNHCGPVHLDLGYSNFFIDGDRLELFDFDNCTLGPFPADIASSLYSSVFHWLRRKAPGARSPFEHPDSSQLLEQVWSPFREGYLSVSPWPEAWNDQMPAWFQVLYFRSVVHTWRLLHPITNPASKAALEADIDNVLHGRIPLHFDFRNGRSIDRQG